MTFLFGGGKGKTESFRPTGFRGGGITARGDGNNITINSGAGRRRIVGNVSRTFGQKAGEIAGLRKQVTPGFGRLTKSRVQAVQSGRRRAIGNLSQNLQNRRIFGSSFGQASLAQAEREFAQEEADVRAQSFLQELELSNQLINDEFQARLGQFQTLLDELNIQADIGLRLASQATGEAGANARLQAQLAAQNQSGFGELFGTLLARFLPLPGA